MRVSIKRSAVTKQAIVLALFLFQTTMWAQDLETPWRNYLSIDARLEAAVESEREWVERQHKLREEIRTLQESQSWYNGWIIELLIARKSSLQVELADSLQQIRKKIADSRAQRDAAFLAFKEVYQRILLESESENRLSSSQKVEAITIGRQLISQSRATFDLPDYASIMNSPYENEAIKHLVMEDLQAVLRAKLVLIDSLLTEKETELVLLSRLNEFHRDLSYQMKSNLDPATAGSKEALSSVMLGSDTYSEDFADGASSTNKRSMAAAGEVGSELGLTTPISQSPVVSGETNISLNMKPTDEVINRLKNKRQQYQDLLRQIETELPH